MFVLSVKGKQKKGTHGILEIKDIKNKCEIQSNFQEYSRATDPDTKATSKPPKQPVHIRTNETKERKAKQI